ncbi:MAG: 4-hydroxy-tetrahydrodipicolinate synthase [Clostridiales bacterium]|nr:4-hydroxy-tetrahydrodipicolinate synthase [Clostridiales bacterium]
MTLFKGVGAAMVTPFGKDGNIDYAVLERYIEHLISNGVSALVPFGTTGEPATATTEEYKKGIEFVVKHANGRVPVIAGAGSNCTAAAYEKAKLAKSLGASGVLVVTPYYNKCTQNGIIAHYKEVAKANIPVISYNVPSRTGVNILPATVRELSKIDGVIGIKEACGNIDQFQATAKVCKETGFDLYSGDDGITATAMLMGAKGVISVACSPAPKLMSELCALCEKGKLKNAQELQFKLNDLISALFIEVNPIPVKKAMQLIGFEVGAPRLPLTELEPQHNEILKTALRELELIK